MSAAPCPNGYPSVQSPHNAPTTHEAVTHERHKQNDVAIHVVKQTFPRCAHRSREARHANCGET
eukprot:10682605-Alexandrium_andersonii.AAC.1